MPDSTSDSEDIESPDRTLGQMLLDLGRQLRPQWLLLVLAPILVGGLTLGATFLIPPTYTAATTFLPPQQSQTMASAALSSLGALGGIAAGAAGIKSSAEQYIALMQSVTVSDRIIKQFDLMKVYDAKYQVDARKTLLQGVRMSAGKKDGLITVEVDDSSPQRAADIANRYVDELRRMTATIAVTEAQQRRAFFEGKLRESRERLTQAQRTLQATGFNPDALKTEPKSAAESYAKLKAEATSAEVRLKTLRSTLSDNTPEVQQQAAALAAIREQLSRAAQATESANGSDYIGHYREFKYQEALFELYARQFEVARTDESREGALIQVVDPATPPERKSKPKRIYTAAGAGAATLFCLLIWVLFLRRQFVLETPAPGNAVPT